MRATAQGCTGIVRELDRARVDPNLESKSEQFPLLEAALFGDADVVRILIDAGADVRACAENGWTALKAAEDRGHSDIAAMLRSAGGTLGISLSVALRAAPE
jgi:ankyrin repeat protein